MKVLFCNISYQRFYDGRIAGELKPETGGRWVRENEDAHEKWNFLNMDGYCYGYVQSGGNQMHIERLDKVYRQQDSADDVTVVWCAIHPERGSVIVGWYEHATVYRICHAMTVTSISGIDRVYWFSVKAENAYLLPEEDRTFSIERASKSGAGKGFGQSNVWYAESNYAKEVIIPNALSFIEAKKSHRINITSDAFEMPEQLPPLSDEEKVKCQDFAVGEFGLDYLYYAYREYANDQTGDNAFNVGQVLKSCYQYTMASKWYEKALTINPDDWEASATLAYLYQQIGEYDLSIKMAESCLENETNQDFREDLYILLSDDYYFKRDKVNAFFWLDKTISESKDKESIEILEEVRKNWETEFSDFE